jgi:hypothetical protein
LSNEDLVWFCWQRSGKLDVTWRSCAVLFCFILFCLILFCFAMGCFVSFCFVVDCNCFQLFLIVHDEEESMMVEFSVLLESCSTVRKNDWLKEERRIVVWIL